MRLVKFLALLILLTLISLFMTGCSNANNTSNNTQGGDNMKNPVVVMETSKGTIEIELDAKNAPITTANFLSYVKEGYYDGLIFHRVMAGFMIQGGGFYENGTQKETNAPIKLESRNGLKNMRGTIAMARTNVSDSATSQFFINLVDNDFLNYRPGTDGYAVFGKVVVGMDIVDQIAKVKTGARPMSDWPIETVLIKKMYLKE
jgi:peptidyl-prolyl cis-trans isomerase A (cyclophilin A)